MVPKVKGSKPLSHPTKKRKFPPDFLFFHFIPSLTPGNQIDVNQKRGQAEIPVHMLNWAVRSVKFLGVEFDQSEDEEVSVSDAAHL